MSPQTTARKMASVRARVPAFVGRPPLKNPSAATVAAVHACSKCGGNEIFNDDNPTPTPDNPVADNPDAPAVDNPVEPSASKPVDDVDAVSAVVAAVGI